MALPSTAVPPRDTLRRATLRAPAAPAEGIGLNIGHGTRLVLHPAPPGSGSRFRWHAAPGAPGREVTALSAKARTPPFCSALAVPERDDGEALLRTPGHLLPALGVDDAVAELEGAPDVPFLDGSALPWCRLIAAGIAESPAPRHALALPRPVELAAEGRFIRAGSAPSLSFDVSMDLAGWGELRWAGVPSGDAFVAALAPRAASGASAGRCRRRSSRWPRHAPCSVARGCPTPCRCFAAGSWAEHGCPRSRCDTARSTCSGIWRCPVHHCRRMSRHAGRSMRSTRPSCGSCWSSAMRWCRWSPGDGDQKSRRSGP
ncbi:UDP-3-O-acyl-N-acetylglucosamine deacetylase [Falsiroseomonas oryzae]|nr:UDP-3-O-acyl-N-acetylglucosamine deacetylase [Roseomonas sp. MO-31]